MTTTDSITMCEYDTVLKINSYTSCIYEIIDEIKEIITEGNSQFLYIDICALNMIDAVKICILCSTFHYAKYSNGKIKWVVKDDMIMSQIELLKLDNIDIKVKQHSKRNYIDTGKTFGSILSLCR